MQRQTTIVVSGSGNRYKIIVGRDADGSPYVVIPQQGKAATMEPNRQIDATYIAYILKLQADDAAVVAQACVEILTEQ